MASNGFLHPLALTDEPQHKEQSHQSRDEVGKGDFPGTAMVPAVAALFLDDNDWAVIAHAAMAFLACLQASSISAFEGRLKE